ncbi:MAG: queuosine precursor transporter [Sphingomonadales bacterium]|nr:queuosine precursor transporter [Sphingomonadales bacterium]
MDSQPSAAIAVPRALYAYTLLYGGLVVLAGVLGTKLASLGTWPVLGSLAVESGIFAFLLLVVLSSTVAELYGKAMADRLVRVGFVPLIVSMILLMAVIHVVPPAPFWHDQDAFARLLGQGARMQLAGLISYGTSQTLNVAVFAKLAGRPGTGLMLRAWIAGVLSQVVDTVLFITISFVGVHDPVTGAALPLGAIMTGQILSKLLLSTIMVPLFIQLFVSLGRRLDART